MAPKTDYRTFLTSNFFLPSLLESLATALPLHEAAAVESFISTSAMMFCWLYSIRSWVDVVDGSGKQEKRGPREKQLQVNVTLEVRVDEGDQRRIQV